MPRAVMTNPVTYENFTRPVALTFIREVARVLRLPGDINVTFAGSAEQTANTGSTLTPEQFDSVFAHNLNITAEVQERAVEDRELTLHAHESEHYPIFLDTKLGVRVEPIYSHSEMMISFKVRFGNRVDAQKFRDDILLRIPMIRQENNHVIDYHYSMANPIMHLLRDIHTLREKVAPYGEDFSQWMNAHIDDRATILTNVAGKRTLLAIPETQTRIWGTFSDITAMAAGAEKDGESGKWTLSFDYRVQYDKPIACRAEWPLVVHNQFINEPWFDSPEASGHQTNHWANKQIRPSYSRQAFDFVANHELDLCAEKFKPTIIPVMDDWSTGHKLPDLHPIVQILVGVNAEQPTYVMDLKDLDTHQWDEDVLTFMRAEAPWMTAYGQSLFHVALYRGKLPQQLDTLTVTSELGLVSANPLDLRDVHHVRVSMLSDLFFLRDDARRRLLEAGEVGKKLLMQLQFMLRGEAFVPRVANGMVNLQDYLIIARLLNQHKRPYSLGREAVMLTVGTYSIVTRRMSDVSSQAHTLADPDAAFDTAYRTGQRVPRCDG